MDHLEPDQVADLVRRIDADHGRLDILVNDSWGGENLVGWDTPLWEHDLRRSAAASPRRRHSPDHQPPRLIHGPEGLIGEVTDGTAADYRLSVFYDLAKTAVLRLAFSQGHELARHSGTAVALPPGWMRSEMMLEAYGVTEANWCDVLDRPAEPPHPDPQHFGISETPTYTGRAVRPWPPTRTAPASTRARCPPGS